HRCGGSALRHVWSEDRQGRRQVRRECACCGTWLGFAPRVPPFTDLADAAASPTPLLDALLLADSEGIQLVSDRRSVRVEPWHKASDRLKDLIRQRQHLLAQLLGNTRRATP